MSCSFSLTLESSNRAGKRRVAIEEKRRNNGLTMLEFRVLGPVEACADSIPLELGGPKQRAVLALLLLRANEFVSRERLIDDVWGDTPPAAARDTVKVYVGRLRRLLSPGAGSGPLATHDGGYLLAIDPEQVDLQRFNRLAERGSDSLVAGDAEGAAALLREALALWRGPPLADLGDVAFARAERARLEELRLAALEARIDADLMLGRVSAIVPELQQLTHEHPYRERLHRQLMLALYRSGRQADALDVYRSLRRHLASELGLEPSPDSRDLERAILTSDSALAPAPVERAAAEADPSSAEQGASHVPRWRLRAWRVGVLGFLVALGVVGAVALRALSGGHEPAASSTVTAGRVEGRIPVPLPGGPWVGKLSFGAGSLWIRKGGDDEVLRIEPRTNKIVARIRVGFAYDTGIAVLGRDVWVTNGEKGTVSRISAADNQVVATVRVGEYPLGIAATKNAVWVANLDSGSVSRIDPRVNRVVKTVPVSTPSKFAGPKAIAVEGGMVWVADARSGAIVRLDAHRNRRVEAIGGTGPACGGMTVFGGSVWVASACDKAKVTRIDVRTARVTAVIRVHGVALDLAGGFGSIWVTTLRGLLLRIDPNTNRITAKLRLGDATLMTTGGGSVWVINRESRSVIRIKPAD
jgi:YVTN family beta-propeller protein